MRHHQGVYSALLAMFLFLLGVAPSASANSSVPAPVAVQTASTTAAATLVKGPWQIEEQGFSTQGTCMSRGRYLYSVQGGYWIGGMAEYKCTSYTTSSCPPQTKWRLMTRDWFDPDGPVRVATGTPLESRSTFVAAC